MPFPILFLALSLAAGIFVSAKVGFPGPVQWAGLLISPVLSWLFYFSRKLKVAFLFVLLTSFFLGIILYSHSDQRFQNNPLHKFQSDEYVDYTGILYKSPSKGLETDHLFIRVESVSVDNQKWFMKGNMRVSVPSRGEFLPLPDLFVGDRVKVSAKPVLSKDFQNFSSSNLDIIFKTRHIHHRVYTKSPLLVEKLKSGKALAPLRLISFLKVKLQKKIEEYFSTSDKKNLTTAGAVSEALLLGNRERLAPPTERALQASGLFHLFAISGAHIALLSFMLFTFLRIIRIPQRTSIMILMAFLVFFAYLVEGRPSVIRATVMAFAFLLGKLLWRQVNLINVLSLSAFILLLFNPFSLFALGFQLTFTATLSIILFFPKIIRVLPRLPFRISEIFALSLSAQLGVLPFLVYSFNRVSFASLFLNIAALPLVGLIMGCGYVFWPLAFLSPPLAKILAAVMHIMINSLIFLSRFFENISFFSYRIPGPPWPVLAGYTVFLVLLLVPVKIKWLKVSFALFFLAFAVLLVTYPFTPYSGHFKVTFIDVGQGDAILVEFPGKEKMLIDGGGVRQGTFDIGEKVVSRFLWKKGIKKIDYLVLTHAHPDHLNGLKAVARNFSIDEYWEAFSPNDYHDYVQFRKELPADVRVKRLFRGDKVLIGKALIEVLHPSKADPLVAYIHNDQSLVMRITFGQVSFLLTGDISRDVERALIKKFPNLSSQVMKSPHHGSRFSSSPEFFDNVAPETVIISVGKRNVYNLPNPEVLELYRSADTEVFRTDKHGAVEVKTDGKTYTVRTAAASEKNI